MKVLSQRQAKVAGYNMDADLEHEPGLDNQDLENVIFPVGTPPYASAALGCCDKEDPHKMTNEEILKSS